MADQPSPPKSETEALCEEFRRVHDRRVQTAPREPGEPVPLQPELRDYRYSVHHLPGGQSALCLSGGGVRSAAFSLGVLQGIAQRGLLSQVHYLSTVSGGGYVGSWLTAWAHRAATGAETAGSTAAAAFEAVETALNARDPATGAEASPLTWLRRNQRFLSPRAGMMSADLWAGIALFLRDLVLNWIVYLPAIAAVLLLPRVLEFLLVFWAAYAYDAGSAFGWLIQGGVLNIGRGLMGLQHVDLKQPEWQGWLDVAGAALVLIGIRAATLERTQVQPGRMDDRAFRHRVLSWVLAAGWLLVMFNAAILAQGARPDLTLLTQWCVGTPFVFLLARLLAAPGRTSRDQLWTELAMLCVAGAAVGAFTWCGLLLRGDMPGATGTVRDFVVFGIPYLLLAFVFGQVIYAGLSSLFDFGRRDAEWLGRASGHYLLAAVSWAALFAVILYGEPLQPHLLAVVLPVSGTAGALTLGAAASALTKARGALDTARQWLPGTILLKIGLAVFLLGAAIAIALATERLIWQVFGVNLSEAGNLLSGKLHGLQQMGHGPVVDEVRLDIQRQAWGGFLLAAFCALFLMCFSAAAALIIDVNVFSLHGLYLTRLVRTFLGASNVSDPRRSRFSGFAPGDDLELAKIWRDESGNVRREGPFPVLNMALNLVGSADLSVQDRKAEPFVATPLHYGSARVGYVAHEPNRRRRNLSLGTAMAISGAAASPNWGYHSSPLMGFVLMLFNLRLGWWLENPRYRRGRRAATGEPSGRLFAQEALGRTSDTDPYIYLSDGGHFDNLGVYRCSGADAA